MCWTFWLLFFQRALKVSLAVSANYPATISNLKLIYLRRHHNNHDSFKSCIQYSSVYLGLYFLSKFGGGPVAWEPSTHFRRFIPNYFNPGTTANVNCKKKKKNSRSSSSLLVYLLTPTYLLLILQSCLTQL